MIKEFEVYIPSTAIAYRIKGKLNDYSWDNEEYREIYNSFRKAIRWKHGDKVIQVVNSEGKIQGYVSLDWKYVLATHYKSPEIDFPKNAIVYNADGSIHLFLEPEKLLAKHPKEKHDFYLEGMGFNSVRWMKNAKDETVLAIEVCYPDRLTEFWEVDPETGEFGELLYRSMEK